jgi:hypothetical protein
MVPYSSEITRNNKTLRTQKNLKLAQHYRRTLDEQQQSQNL